MSALRSVAGWLIGVMLAVGAGTASAPAVEIKDLGAQRLTMGRAATDIRDSAGQRKSDLQREPSRRCDRYLSARRGRAAGDCHYGYWRYL